MSNERHFASVTETDTVADFVVRIRAGLFVWGFAAVILVAGFIWLGWAGMTDPKSPDFFPLPDFFAVAAFAVGTFFIVRSALFGIRHGRFGTSVLEVNEAALGGLLEGRVRTERDVDATGPFSVKLQCGRRYYQDHFDNSASRAECLWVSTQELPATARSSQGLSFAIRIPETGLASGCRRKPRTGVHPEDPDEIEWTLGVSAPVAGLNYAVTFPVWISGPAREARTARTKASRTTGGPKIAQASGKTIPRETPLPRFGLALISLATPIIGGRVPDAEERRAIRGGEDAGADYDEPDTPFAGEIQPEQSDSRLFRRVLLGFGLLLVLSGAWATFQQVRLNFVFERTAARITTVEPGNALAIELSGGAPARVNSVTRFHSWHVGQDVVVLCGASNLTPRRCQMDTGFDRFLYPLAAMVIGLAFLAVSWRLRYRPRPKANNPV